MRAGALFCLAFFTAAVPAAAFPAHVLRCHDGDICTVATGQGTVRVQLAEIDAPEIDQPYGPQARDVLCSMVCGKEVDIEPRGTSYDRVVGLIRVGGLDTSEVMSGQEPHGTTLGMIATLRCPRWRPTPADRAGGFGPIFTPCHHGTGVITGWGASDHRDDNPVAADQLVPAAHDPPCPGLQQATSFVREDLRLEPPHVDPFHALHIADGSVVGDRGRAHRASGFNNLQLGLQHADVAAQFGSAIGIIGHDSSTSSFGSWSRPSYPAGLQITRVSPIR